jgi:hypothetical protein
MMGIIMSIMIAFSIAAVANCVNVAVAQYDPTTGRPLYSPPSPPSSPSSAGNITAPAGNITAPAGNITAPDGNSTIIGPAPGPTIVGPSSLVASPITSENQGNVNTQITPSNKSSLEQVE